MKPNMSFRKMGESQHFMVPSKTASRNENKKKYFHG